jgi:hypothetical protein
MKDTSTILIDRMKDTSNILIDRIKDTSNILIGRIKDTSNYILSTSNILVIRANLSDSNSSNYVLSTSNILIAKVNLSDSNSSNYVLSTSNILIAKVNLSDSNSSNYVKSTSNIFVDMIKNNKSSQWTTTSDGYIYYNSNVGIGTSASLSNLLDVNGRINSTEYYINNVKFLTERQSASSNVDQRFLEPTMTPSYGFISTIANETTGIYKTLTFNYYSVPPTPATTIPTNNIVAIYKFDGNGSNSISSSLNYTLSKTSGTIEYSSGSAGSNYWQGRRYLKANEGVLSTSNLQLGSEFSISVWIRPKTVDLGQIILFQDINTKIKLYIGYAVGIKYYITFQDFTNNPNNGLETPFQLTESSSKDTWMNLVFVAKSLTTPKQITRSIYRNGNILGTNTISNIGYNLDPGLRISCGDNNASSDLRDLRIYNIALSADQVSALYLSYTCNNYSINFSESNTAVVNNRPRIDVFGTYNISLDDVGSAVIPNSNQLITPLEPTTTPSELTIKYPILRNDITFAYKKDGFLKYVAGDQSSIITRNTGQWVIADYDTIGSALQSSIYELSTSNNLAINILTNLIKDTSNYVLATSNILIIKADINNINSSNYVLTTSNILISNIKDTSNYVLSTSNILINRIKEASNYVLETSNILIGRIKDTSNYILSTSNYIIETSNILINRIKDTSNYLSSTSNILIGSIKETSNYVLITSNILINNIKDASNYVLSTSNILINRIFNTSNYVLSTSNIILEYINNKNFSQWTTLNNNIYYNTFNVGIGINNPTSKLTINNFNNSNFNHTDAPLTITNDIPTTAINSSRDVLHLCRLGSETTVNHNIGLRASFKLAKWQATEADKSRTRLDIELANDAYNNSVNIMTIRSDGKVAIGITDPSTALHVNGTITADSFSGSINVGGTVSGILPVSKGGTGLASFTNRNLLFANTLTSIGQPNNLFWDDTNSKLLIGTTVSDANCSTLTINSNITTYNHSEAPLTITNQIPTTILSSIISEPVNVLHLCRVGVATVASLNTGMRASFKLGKYDAFTNTSKTRLDIALADGTYTNESTTIMTILSSGRVGIGKTNPTAYLHVEGETNIVGTITGGTSASSIRLASGSISAIGTDAAIPLLIATKGTGNLTLTTNATERMTINGSTGNLGIGTTSHSTYKLNVNGTLNATSILVGESAISGSKWSIAATTTNIFYNNGNVGIGTNNPNNLFQVGVGTTSRLRIANSTSDYTIIGTEDVDGLNNTCIVLSGKTRNFAPGSIQYTAVEIGGVHIFSTNGLQRMRIASDGCVGIGVASPLATLHIQGTGLIDGTNKNIGNILATGDITAYYSDERLKTKISTINNPLSIVNKLHGFYYIPNEIATKYGINNNKVEIGLSAQDVQNVLPELVKLAPFDMKMSEEGEIISKSGEKYLTISYERLVPVLIEAIKELNQKNISFTNEINTMIKINEYKEIIKSQEERIKDLETKITRILNYINI